MPRPGVCQGGYPQSPDAPGGTEVLWGRRGAGGVIRKSRQEAPRRETRQRPAGVERGAQHSLGRTPGRRPSPLAFALHVGELTGRLQGPSQTRRPANGLRRWTPGPALASLGPAPALNPKQGSRGQRRRGEDAVPPQVAPVVASHTRVCPLLANPHPGPSHPGKTGQAPSLLGSPPPKGVGRGGLREPPGSEVPGFSVPVDGNPRNTGSQVGSVWSINTARKMCCEHWLWAQLRPGPWLRSLQEGLAGSRRHSTVRSPQRGLAAACHCLSTTRFP